MTYSYVPRGICARKIQFDMEDGIIRNVTFLGGCQGNTTGVGRLVEGMEAQEVIRRLKGIDCGGKGTSCPDQLSKAIEEALNG